MKLAALTILLLLPSCQSSIYRQPEGRLWEREGGALNPFFYLRP